MKILFFLGFTCIIMACTPPNTTTIITTTSTTNTLPQPDNIKYADNLNTAKNANYMTEREKAMIAEVNLLRSDPKGYIKIVEKYIADLEASKANVISGMSSINDEIKTAKNLIKELRGMSAFSILKPNESLYAAAKSHGMYMKKSGKFDHTGKGGSSPWDRVLDGKNGLKNAGENLVGGPASVREAVLILAVDSGIPGYGHRRTLLDPSWEYLACYEAGEVSGMPHTWVQNFAN